MALVFRTTDALRWGKGQGFNLVAAQADRNFWDLYEELQGAIGHVDTMVVSIDYVTVTGDQLTVVLTDHSRQGPFTIPRAEFIWTGEWIANVNYSRGSLITEGNALYFALETHISPAHFSPDATDGAGHPLYALMLSAPEGVLPPHGATGQVLVKASDHDYDVEWATVIGMPVGGATNQVLTKTSDHDYVTAWEDQQYVPAAIGSSFSTTTYTPVLADANTYKRYTGSSNTTVTLPLNSSVAFPVGTEMHFRQASSGTITIVAAGGAMLNGISGFLASTVTQGGVLTVKQVSANSWDVFGMLASS